MPAGRPSIYSQELADRILTEYSKGRSIREICEEADMPDRITLWRWRNEKPDFASALARAREANAETIEDKISEIESKVLYENLNPQAANVVLSSMRWRARVLHPKRYGDKVDLEHKGEVGMTVVVKQFTDVENNTAGE